MSLLGFIPPQQTHFTALSSLLTQQSTHFHFKSDATSVPLIFLAATLSQLTHLVLFSCLSTSLQMEHLLSTGAETVLALPQHIHLSALALFITKQSPHFHPSGFESLPPTKEITVTFLASTFLSGLPKLNCFDSSSSLLFTLDKFTGLANLKLSLVMVVELLFSVIEATVCGLVALKLVEDCEGNGVEKENLGKLVLSM